MSRFPINFALTSHGLGHATRTVALARELVSRHPEIEVVFSTRVDKAWIARTLGSPLEYRPAEYEPGVIQKSCFELDVHATRNAYRDFFADRKKRLEAERTFLRSTGCSAVISDIPALPVRAAQDLGIPAVGVSNFTWDWILEDMFEGSQLTFVTRQLADDYRAGTWHFRLPLGPSTSPFPRSESARLVGRRARLSPAEVIARLGLRPDPSRRLVVVCPGGWAASNWDAIHVSGCDKHRFVLVGDLPITLEAPHLHLPHELLEGLSFPDLVSAADVVIAKPGYGIGSECALHATRLVSIERPGFRETPVLLADLRTRIPLVELSLADFFAGAWQEMLEHLETLVAPPPEPAQDGISELAGRVAEVLGLRR